MRVCFLTKKEKYGTKEAISFVKEVMSHVDVYYCEFNTEFPKEIKDKEYDIIISYISTWIVPENVLIKTRYWNINFHPGSEYYPGIGCFNFALYENAKEFGAVAHIMEPRVDMGKIIGAEHFEISENENVETLSMKTYKVMLKIFKYIIIYIKENNVLPATHLNWKRKPFTRLELEELATIKCDMSKKELEHRIKSTYYPNKPGPFILLNDYKFEYNPNR